jgi:hypothetical protein
MYITGVTILMISLVVKHFHAKHQAASQSVEAMAH